VDRSTVAADVALTLVGVLGGLALLLAYHRTLWRDVLCGGRRARASWGCAWPLGANASNLLRLVISRGLGFNGQRSVAGRRVGLALTRWLGTSYTRKPIRPAGFRVSSHGDDHRLVGQRVFFARLGARRGLIRPRPCRINLYGPLPAAGARYVYPFAMFIWPDARPVFYERVVHSSLEGSLSFQFLRTPRFAVTAFHSPSSTEFGVGFHRRESVKFRLLQLPLLLLALTFASERTIRAHDHNRSSMPLVYRSFFAQQIWVIGWCQRLHVAVPRWPAIS